MRRICIISDIHGNLYALQEFLKYIDENYDIEYILNLGDFLQDGPNQCEVFDIVMKDKRFINIMGNSEYELIYVDFADEEIDEYDVAQHIIWARKQLGEERLNTLKGLPLYTSIELYGCKFFMMHAEKEVSSRVPCEYGLGSILHKYLIRHVSKKELALTFNEHNYLLISANHLQGIEQYEVFKDEGYSIIQPGAIGSLDNGDIRFAIIEIGEFEENILFKTLKYDWYKVIKECKEKEVPDPSHGIYLNKLNEEKDYYNMLLSNKYDPDIVPMDFSFWEQLIEPYLSSNKYIIFGIWKNEHQLYDELRKELNIISVENVEKTKQIFIKTENNEAAKRLIRNKYLSSDGRIKWFDISFFNEEDNYTSISVQHNGCEIYLYQVEKERIGYIETIINPKMVRMSFI